MIIANLRNITPEMLLAMIADEDNEFFDALFSSVEDWDDLEIVHCSVRGEEAGSLTGEEVREAMRRAGRL